MLNLSEIKGCVFDAYGTLFDFSSAISRNSIDLGEKKDQMISTWRLKQIEYTQLRSLMGRYTDFETVTREALCYALKSVGVEDKMLVDQLMESYFLLDPYDDAFDLIRDLSLEGYWCSILSNGSMQMLKSAVSAAKLNENLNAVLSVETVGVFKPHPSTYRMAVAESGIEARRILFVSSNPWDVAGASTFGFKCAWINRTRTIAENIPGQADFEIETLAALKPLLKKT